MDKWFIVQIYLYLNIISKRCHMINSYWGKFNYNSELCLVLSKSKNDKFNNKNNDLFQLTERHGNRQHFLKQQRNFRYKDCVEH